MTVNVGALGEGVLMSFMSFMSQLGSKGLMTINARALDEGVPMLFMSLLCSGPLTRGSQCHT